MFNVCPECEHVAPGTRQWERVECPNCGANVVMRWVLPRSRATHGATCVSFVSSGILIFASPLFLWLVRREEYFVGLGLLGLLLLGANGAAFLGLSKAPTRPAYLALCIAALVDYAVVMLAQFK